MQLPIKLPFDLMLTRWSSILNPLLANRFIDGQILSGISVINGTTVINHKLGRMQQGWVVTDLNATATIYRSASFNSTTLTLTSNAAATISLWVF